jgi:hypothetical protein
VEQRGVKLLTAAATALLVAALVVIWGGRGDAYASESGDQKIEHCTASVESLKKLQPGEQVGVTRQSDMACFDTFAEAVAHATNGAVNLPADAVPASLTDEILNAAKAIAAQPTQAP